jgi:hypothetical protein
LHQTKEGGWFMIVTSLQQHPAAVRDSTNLLFSFLHQRTSLLHHDGRMKVMDRNANCTREILNKQRMKGPEVGKEDRYFNGVSRTCTYNTTTTAQV